MKTRTMKGAIKALESDNPHGEFEVILSAPTMDRDGEVIDAKAFEPLPDHITFDIDHGMSVSTTVGSGVPSYDGDLLKVRGTFSSIPLAQTVRTLVTEGHIRSTSVAFMEAKRTVKDGVPHITQAELLNGAFVAIPSNREAAILAAKEFSTKVDVARDTAVRSLKSVIGSYEERTERLTEALRQQFSEADYLYVRATFDDSVVIEAFSTDGTTRTLRVPYSINEGVIALGNATDVRVSEIITDPDQFNSTADADTFLGERGVSASSDTDPEGKAAAPAAASPPAEVTRARVEALLAEAHAVSVL